MSASVKRRMAGNGAKVVPILGLAFTAIAVMLLASCIASPFGHPAGATALAARYSDDASEQLWNKVPAEAASSSSAAGKYRPSMPVNDNIPRFTEADLARGQFEEYNPLDSLGRCGPAFALIGKETMPGEPRGSIGMVKPTGWHTARYDWVDGGYLFNRCHLIGYQLAGENDNELNLITGTRSLNILGMQPFEDRVASYVEATGNHVLYRVTPVFEGSNLVASGVVMEAQSIEDAGAGVRFCVWCANIEPGVTIDYATGKNASDGTMESSAMPSKTLPDKTLPAESGRPSEGGPAAEGEPTAEGEGALAQGEGEGAQGEEMHYILNTRSKRFHYPDCPSVQAMKDKNKREFTGTRDEVLASGYSPCGNCNP